MIDSQTDRLKIRALTLDDADFVLKLVNEPSWIEYIGDKAVHSLEDARHYLESGPLASYAEHGFGMFLIADRHSGTPMGMCGLIRRDGLDAEDIGFAFLPAYWGQGYALEAARAVVAFARDAARLPRLLAITLATNRSSIALLKRLGFARAGTTTLPGDPEPLELYELSFTETKR